MQTCLILVLFALTVTIRTDFDGKEDEDADSGALVQTSPSVPNHLCTIRGPNGGPEFEVDIAMSVKEGSSCNTQCLVEKSQIFHPTGAIFNSLVTSFDEKCRCSQHGEPPLLLIHSAKNVSECKSLKSTQKCWSRLQFIINYDVERKKKIDYGNLGDFSITNCEPCQNRPCKNQIRGLHDLFVRSIGRLLHDAKEDDVGDQGSSGHKGKLNRGSFGEPGRLDGPKGAISLEINELRKELPEGMLSELHLKGEVLDDLAKSSKVIHEDQVTDGESLPEELSHSPTTTTSSCNDDQFSEECIVCPNSGGQGWFYQLREKNCRGNVLLLQLNEESCLDLSLKGENRSRLIALRFKNVIAADSIQDATLGGHAPLHDAFLLKDVSNIGMQNPDSRHFATLEGSETDGIHALLSNKERSTAQGPDGDMQLTLIGSGLAEELGRSQDVKLVPEENGVRYTRLEIQETHQEEEYLYFFGGDYVTTTLQEAKTGFVSYLPPEAVRQC